MEPRIHTEYLRSGRACTLALAVFEVKAVVSFYILSAIPGKTVLPPDNAILQ